MTTELDVKTRQVDLNSFAFDGFNPQATDDKKHINTFPIPAGRAIEFSTKWGTPFRVQDEDENGTAAVSRNNKVVLRVGRGSRRDDGRRVIVDNEQRVIGWVRHTGRSR